MKYPILSEISTSREMITVFGGYNHNLRISAGEFYDMMNLTSDDYPLLSPRAQRGTFANLKSPQGMIARDTLCYVDGSDIVINGYRVEMGLSTSEENCPKTLVSMGSYIIVMPDKMWVNTIGLDFGAIEASVTTISETTFTHCKLDGTDYSGDDVTISSEAPENPADLDYWIDTSYAPHTLKQYSATGAMWVSIATTYVKITATGIGIPFEVGDGVTISGIEVEELKDLNNTMIIQGRGDDYIIVIGIIDCVKGQLNPITVKRQMPNMDFIIESGNRLWGCRYGLSVNNEFVNEIYASKLGDFKNWSCFEGISTDSYTVSLGTAGPFTGAITHLGYPLFFKENYLHKVYGNYPANYQMQTTACRGVQIGSGKSLAIVNEVLFYKSNSAICSYDGSFPTEVSFALGNVEYYNAVAGAIGNKYYVCMEDINAGHTFFVYDSQKRMWHKEDNSHALEFCYCRGELFYIDASDKSIKTVRGSGTKQDTAKITWEAITGVLGTDSPGKKYISRIDVRIKLELNTTVHFFVQYDSNGEWKKLCSIKGSSLNTFSVPVIPHRCDHLRLKIVGNGNAKIYSICKTITEGSSL